MQNGIIPSHADLHYLFCANRQFFDNLESKYIYILYEIIVGNKGPTKNMINDVNHK